MNERIDAIIKETKEYKNLVETNIKDNFDALETMVAKNNQLSEYLENHINTKSAFYDEQMKLQNEKIDEFVQFIGSEYIDFFKNRHRIKNEILENSNEYKDKFQQLLVLSVDYSKKFHYIEQLLPVLVEQTKFTAEILKQDVV